MPAAIVFMVSKPVSADVISGPDRKPQWVSAGGNALLLFFLLAVFLTRAPVQCRMSPYAGLCWVTAGGLFAAAAILISGGILRLGWPNDPLYGSVQFRYTMLWLGTSAVLPLAATLPGLTLPIWVKVAWGVLLIAAPVYFWHIRSQIRAGNLFAPPPPTTSGPWIVTTSPDLFAGQIFGATAGLILCASILALPAADDKPEPLLLTAGLVGSATMLGKLLQGYVRRRAQLQIAPEGLRVAHWGGVTRAWRDFESFGYVNQGADDHIFLRFAPGARTLSGLARLNQHLTKPFGQDTSTIPLNGLPVTARQVGSALSLYLPYEGGESFECDECGTLVSQDALRCPGCGELFEP